MRKINKGVLLVFILAFLIRLINLNQSLWLDEATTAMVVKNYGFLEIVTKFSPFDFHPPLYYWMMKAWTNIFGYSEVALRFPSIIFSLLTGYVIYRIVSLFHGFIVGAWAAVFFLFNPLIVYYSQEARMYMMAIFLLTAALSFLLKNLQVNGLTNDKLIKEKLKIKNQNDKVKLKNLIFFNFFIILSLLTFYGSVFFVSAILIYLLLNKNYKNLFICLFVLFVYFLSISPLLQQQFVNSRISLATVKNWSLVLGKANIKNLLLIPVKFSIGRIDFYPKWLYYLGTGSWTMFILYQIIKIKNQNDKEKIKNLFVFLLLIPLLLGFVISFFIPLLQYFRFIYLIPIMAILLGFGAKGVRWIIVTGFIILSFVYLLIPKFHREDWKSLAKSLPEKSVVYMVQSSSDPLKYYRQDLIINGLTDISKTKKNSIIVIPYTAEIHGTDYLLHLSEQKFKHVESKNFGEIYYQIWKR